MPTENDSSTSSVQLGEAGASNQVGGPMVDQVFSLFKDYLQNQLETKTKEIEQKSKIDKSIEATKSSLSSMRQSIPFWRALNLKPNRVNPKVKCDHRSKFFKQLERSLKKVRASTGFEPMTSAIPVRCSTN